MRAMKSKIITLKPGTILCWKDYNVFKRAWCKITGKQLYYNRYAILTEPIDFITLKHYDSYAYEPVRRYNQKEINKLVELVKANKGAYSFADIKVMIDAIRPNTFKNVAVMDECKYYKKLDLDANAAEFLYEIE